MDAIQIDISTVLDNEYTIFPDGRVRRKYDRNQWSFGNITDTTVRELENDVKAKLLESCPLERKADLEAIFNS